MSDKASLKRYNGTAFAEVYPKTTHDQIIASGTPLSTTFLSGTGVWATPQGTSNHSHAAGDVTSGTFADARIPNLNGNKITAGTVSVLRLPLGSVAGNASSNFWNPQNTSIAKFSSAVGWFTTTENGSIYSSNALFIKRIWKKGATESNWTTVFNAGTGTGTQISVNATFTQINLNYTGSATDMYMIEFSNNSNNGLGKGVAHIGSGTFSGTAGMAVISYDAYETVTGAGQLQIAKYFAQVQRTQVGSSAALSFRYASKVRIV